MAVAFMANSQHLFARTDILEQAGISEIPTTYEGVLDAAEAIRAAGHHGEPAGDERMQVGWNLAELFNTVYLAMAASSSNPAPPSRPSRARPVSRRWR
jgi:multiple sugar transport system substrate-binding protein